jgi:hypothetical protein
MLQSLMQRSIDIRAESSTSEKLFANGVFGFGPRQPAKEKEAPSSEVTSVGPGSDSLEVAIVGSGIEVVDALIVDSGKIVLSDALKGSVANVGDAAGGVVETSDVSNGVVASEVDKGFVVDVVNNARCVVGTSVVDISVESDVGSEEVLLDSR